MYKAIITTAAALAISAASVVEIHAQQQWTLEQCIAYAMDNNLQLKQKQIATQLSETDIEAKKGALLPNVSLSTGQNASWRPWSKSYVNITDGTFNSTSSELNYNGTYGVSASWTVWNGGRNRLQVDRSRLTYEQSQIDEQTTRNNLQEQIVQLYVQILYQTEAVEVNKQVLESTKTLCARAKEMYEVGQIALADYAQMQAQVSQEQYNVANAGTQLSATKLQLSQILRLPPDETFDVAIPTVSEATLTGPLPTTAGVYNLSKDLRPEIRYYRLGIEGADIDMDIAKRGRYPSLGVNAGINSSASSGVSDKFGTQLKNNLTNSLGLSITLPLFDGHQTSTNIAKARLDKDNATLALEIQEQQLYNDIETYRLNAANATEQYTSALANVASMRESYRLVSEQFSVGLKDIVDLTTGKNNLLQAEQQLLQAKYTDVLNRTLLDFYAGMPMEIK